MVARAATVAQVTSGEVAGIVGLRVTAYCKRCSGGTHGSEVREGSVLPKVTQLVVQQGGTRVHPELGSAGQPSWV